MLQKCKSIDICIEQEDNATQTGLEVEPRKRGRVSTPTAVVNQVEIYLTDFLPK